MKIKVTPKSDSEKEKIYPYLGICNESVDMLIVYFTSEDRGIAIVANGNAFKVSITEWDEKDFTPFEGTLEITI